jgi:hypothetical protein
VPEREGRPFEGAEGAKTRPLGHDLQHAADERSEDEREPELVTLCAEPRRQHQCEHDEGDVQQAGCESGDGEAAMRVQGGRAERCRAHEENVRKHPARERGRAVELPFDRSVAAREELDERRSEHDAEHAREHEDDERQAAERAEEAPRGLVALLLAHFVENGQNRVLCRALGEDLPEDVRNRERDEEGVGGRAREDRGDRLIAHEPEQAARERAGRNDPGPPSDAPVLRSLLVHETPA